MKQESQIESQKRYRVQAKDAIVESESKRRIFGFTEIVSSSLVDHRLTQPRRRPDTFDVTLEWPGLRSVLDRLLSSLEATFLSISSNRFEQRFMSKRITETGPHSIATDNCTQARSAVEILSFFQFP